jgi:Uma2 family endonuclease
MSAVLRPITLAEYETRERDAFVKSEYYRGEMFAMAGGSPEHSLVATNFTREAGNQLKGKPCVPYNSDLRIKVEASELYTYPDATIVCGPPQMDNSVKGTVLNPSVIVEVLSDSTESYDRGRKSSHYRRIESLRELILISPSEPLVEMFTRRDDGNWSFVEYRAITDTLVIGSVGVAIPLSELYRNISFQPAAPVETKPIGS